MQPANNVTSTMSPWQSHYASVESALDPSSEHKTSLTELKSTLKELQIRVLAMSFQEQNNYAELLGRIKQHPQLGQLNLEEYQFSANDRTRDFFIHLDLFRNFFLKHHCKEVLDRLRLYSKSMNHWVGLCDIYVKTVRCNPKIKKEHFAECCDFLHAQFPKLTTLSLCKLDFDLDGEKLEMLAKRCPALTSLDLDNTKVDDAGMQFLSQGCPALTSLNLWYATRVTDTGMQFLSQRCTALRELDLYKTEVTETGLQSLSQGCTALTALDLTCTMVTDAGMQFLSQRCPALTVLDLSETNVRDTGVQFLSQGCTVLTSLNLSKTEVTDKGLRFLSQGCTALTSLDLDDTDVTDVGLQFLSQGCTALCKLVLGGTKVTDSGVRFLSQGCTALTSLDLDGTFVKQQDYWCEYFRTRNH